MRLFETALLASAVAAEYDYYGGERGKKKKQKQVKRDACGCELNPRNAPDAVPTCVDDSTKRKKIDWTCAATGLVERTERKCKKLKKKDLAEPCGDLGCRCETELAAFAATVSGSAFQCRKAGKKNLYKLWCDDNSDGLFTDGETFQMKKVKCKNGELRKNKFTLTCGGDGDGGGDDGTDPIVQNADGTGGAPPAIRSYVTIQGDANAGVGANAHAADSCESLDGGFIAAGVSQPSEFSTVRQFFVTKIKTCDPATTYTNAFGTMLTGAGTNCAENYDWSFLKTGNNCNAVSVKESADGTYVLAAGLHQSTGVAETYNGYVVKLDALTGAMIWEFDYTTNAGARSGFETLHLTSDGGFIVGGFINRVNGEFPAFKSGGQVDDGTPVLHKFSPEIANAASVSDPQPTWTYTCDGTNSVTCNLANGSMKNMRVYADSGGEKVVALPTPKSNLVIVDVASGAEVAYSGDGINSGFIGDGTANDIEVVLDGNNDVEGFVVTGLRDKFITTDGGETCTGDGCKVIDGFFSKYKPDLSGKLWDTLIPTGTWPGGINQFAGLTASAFESLVYTECWGMDKVTDTNGAHVGYVAACGTGIEPGCGIHPGAIGTACSTDARTAWRGAITRIDLAGNLVWYRMDSFNDLSASGESASEYIFQAKNGHIVSLTDEGFGGFGFETLELEV
ncbi:unnamed protein product [Oikopleura dioica]|uniref:Uncharacterized protein n=1 Tax=Oikopleura dioica TaxID=34765 RepID=E4XRT0_OIKDI|nr:unnamed protein product [Oikopleura dioica]